MAKTAVDYTKRAPFNKTAFTAAYAAEFKGVPKYNAASIPDLLGMLEMMEQDHAITDIRWMAYLLATTFIESSQTVKIAILGKNKHGHQVRRTAKVWRNFKPIDESEHGRKRAYGPAVKLYSLPDGSMRVTEADGKQWTVLANGHIHGDLQDQDHGVDWRHRPSDRYRAASGMEYQYFGRGYVMLTWWDNYVRTGFMIGVGLDLLLDPDLAYEPKIAYKIISTGMLTGQGFAHRHKFTDYFHGNLTDYVGARAMVNGKSGQHEIAGLAERFEHVLRASSPGGTPIGGSAS
jgi:hypothetical protein